jgi:hypothetical protein
MNHFIVKFKVDERYKFTHWAALQKFVKDVFVSVNLESSIRQLFMIDVRQDESTHFPNTLSATANLADNTLTKICRVGDTTRAEDLFKKLQLEKKREISLAAKAGVTIMELEIVKDVVSDEDKVHQTLSTLNILATNSKYSLLKNISPLHTERTDYGIVNVYNNYSEVFFNEGHIGYTKGLDRSIHKHIYYAMYTNATVNDKFRFAYLRSNDFANYISFATPTGSIGTNSLMDNIDSDTMKEFIDEVVNVVEMFKHYSPILPNEPVRLENRYRDSIGNYYHFLGDQMTLKPKQFIELQSEYLNQLLNYLDTSHIDVAKVKKYADKWRILG